MGDDPSIPWRILHREVEKTARMGTWVHDPSSPHPWWSDQFFELLGYERGDIEPSIDLFLSLVIQDDRKRVQENIERSLEPVEYRIQRADGTIVPVVATTTKLTIDGEERLMGAVWDISEQRNRERALERACLRIEDAQAIAKVGAWSWNITTGELEVSPQLRRIVRLEDGDVGFDRFDALVHPEDKEKLLQLRALTVRTGEPSPVEVRLVHPNGDVQFVAMSGRKVPTPAGTLLVGALHDVTERHKLEQSVRLSETLQALGRLAAGIAHDFNNLLTVVLGHARVLQEKDPSDDIAAILQAGESGAELTRRLLAFAHESPAEMRAVVLEELLSESVRMLSRLLGDQVRLQLVASPDHTPVYLDPAHLDRALLSLAANSQDAMPQGGTIEITTRPLTQDGHEGVEMAMSDNGAGMDEATLRRALEPFFTTKEPSEGGGLGMAVAYGIVRQMGGTMNLESVVGKGTTVRIWLPRTDHAPPESDRPLRDSHPGLRTVLVVEDEPLVRRLVQRVLERAGFEVLMASGPQEALELAAQHSYDVLLTDLTMPEGGGRRVVRELRVDRPDLRVLYMTGFAPDVDTLDGPVLFKPFRPDKLIYALNALLDE